MRRILYYSLLCLLWVSVNSCNDDEASQPPTPTISVDKTSGLLSDTKFIFTVEQVGSGAMSLLPYGTENPSFGGVLIPSSSFTNGVAKVEFTYGRVGTYKAVASANNHSGDGKSVKTSYSNPVQVVITSDKATMSDFSFDGSTATVVTPDDENKAADHDVKITIPWSKHNDVTKLKLRFSKSSDSKVTVTGGAEQESDKTENNFTSTVKYTVTSQDGSASRTYNVSIIQTAAEANTNFKSLNAIITNKGRLDSKVPGKKALKAATGRVLPSFIDNGTGVIIVYDTLNANPTVYDSMSLDFALDGKFSNVKFHEANWKKHKLNDRVKAKDTVDLKGGPLDLEVTMEDSVANGTPRKVFSIYTAEAPRLHVETTNFIPNRSGDSNEAFAVGLDAIGGTPVQSTNLKITFELPPNTTITNVDVVQDNGAVKGTVGVGGVFTVTGVDLEKAATVKATVSTTGLPQSYVVSYSLSITIK